MAASFARKIILQAFALPETENLYIEQQVAEQRGNDIQ
jgi:hypothetical protein